jgi:hypothetical protein
MEEGYFSYEFIELSSFERQIKKICNSEEEEERIKHDVAKNRRKGDSIIGSSGIKKIRVALEGQGKSGSARVVYYYTDDNTAIVYFLLIFKKGDQEELTSKQEETLLKILNKIKK